MSKRIIIDIGHPAHVHYFRNFMSIMKGRGYEFKVIARDKEVTHDLLKSYSIEYVTRGKGANGLFGKFKYLFSGTKLVLREAKTFKPDFFISFGSPYAALASSIYKKPHIVFGDSDHGRMGAYFVSLFSKLYLNPVGYKNRFWFTKQIFFNSYTELFYLHPKYYTSDSSNTKKMLGLSDDDDYCIIRFVGWKAHHDINAKGLSNKDKMKLIDHLSQKTNVFISSEEELPESLQRFKLNIPVDKIHDVLSDAALFVGESGTMSSECAMLGVPNVQIRHTLERDKVPGVHLKLEERGLKILKHSKDISGIIDSANHILDHYDEVKVQYQQKKDEMISEVDDLNDILIDMIIGYPESIKKYSEH